MKQFPICHLRVVERNSAVVESDDTGIALDIMVNIVAGNTAVIRSDPKIWGRKG